MVTLSGACFAADVEILETGPLGSELDRPPVRNALDAFPSLFDRAESTLDIAQMYMLYYPPTSRGRALYPLYDAIIRAAQRGVRVRILLDSLTLADNDNSAYRRMRRELDAVPGIDVRACDLRPFSRYDGCIQHAKYLVVDGKLAVVGSHNWSFGAFTDNVELSLAVDDAAFARQVRAVFETDWAAAAGAVNIARAGDGSARFKLVVTAPWRLRDSTLIATEEAIRHAFTAADSTLDIEVNSLTTRRDFGHGGPYLLVDSLLRDADRRGVRVRLLVDKWADEQEPGLFHSLDSLGHVEVRVIDIEGAGPNPQRGTVHAKLALADGAAILLGSATFSQRQLAECRNVGVLLEDPVVGVVLRDLFERSWFSVLARSP